MMYMMFEEKQRKERKILKSERTRLTTPSGVR